MEYAFDYIFSLDLGYEYAAVFDADNIVDKDFLFYMNKKIIKDIIIFALPKILKLDNMQSLFSIIQQIFIYEIRNPLKLKM